ncbi:NACHT domain-containing protein [Prosthecobacter debontii]|nr:hypothetical protein [Prosthecobacter debontii]
MALLYRHRASLPHGRAKVYAAISEAYLEGIDLARRTQGIDAPVPYTRAEKEQLLAIIAMQMQMRRLGQDDEDAKGEVIVSQGDLEAWLCPEFGHGEDALNREAMTTFIGHIADRSGLLLPRGMQEGQEQYAFAHLSFQEYYTACWLEREFRRLLNLKAGTEDDLDLLDSIPEPVPIAPLVLEEADFAKHAAETLWREPLLFLAERLADSVSDTQTLRKWLFPIKPGVTLAETAQHLLATLSIDPQVNFPLPLRQQLWNHLWRLHLDRGDDWWMSGAAPALLEPSEFQAAVLQSLRATVEAAPGDRLSLHDCTGLSDLTPLAGLSGLKLLDLTGCTGLSDLAPLEGLSGLQWLYLSNCTGLSDLAPLARLFGLQDLDLSNCTGLSDLEPLAGLSNLRALNLLNCTGFRDLAPLAALSGLQSLGLLGCTGLSDLAPLEGLSGMWVLYLIGCTGLSDLAPLAGLSSLRILDLSGCSGVTEEQVEELRKALPECDIIQ